MTSIDPDPDRTLRPPQHGRTHVSLDWSPAARHEYSRLQEAPTRTVINSLARKATRQTLLHAPFKLPLPPGLAASPKNTFAIDVSFVSDAEIMELNSSHRGKAKATDVLSFSQLEGESMPFPGEEILLGDIVISVETAARQAGELKHSLQQEMAFLLVHGALHLCGYDHDTSSKRRAMWKQQDEIVQLLMAEE